MKDRHVGGFSGGIIIIIIMERNWFFNDWRITNVAWLVLWIEGWYGHNRVYCEGDMVVW